MDINRSLIEFINQSPDSFHAADNVCKVLGDNGFTKYESAKKINFGDKIFFTKNSSAVFAVKIPEKLPESLVISASHGDSPTFKLKYNRTLNSGGAVCLNTERYGGAELKSWFDIPLGVSGRLTVKTENGFNSVLCRTDKPVCIIPNTPVHLLRDREPNLRTDFFPLYSLDKNADVLPYLCDEAGVKAEDVLSCDLFLYNHREGMVWGEKDEFISSPRLDDLQCVYPSLLGFIDAEASESMPVYCLFDNEEVGSSTKQGADSDALPSFLKTVLLSLGASERDIFNIFSSSFAISADNAHALHPNHPELNDPLDRPVINGGITLKFNASQRYTTDAVSAALTKLVAAKAGVGLQYYSNRSDIPGGSTLGNILTRHLSVDCADIGLPQLAMHSAYETAGCRDTESLYRFMKTLFSSTIKRTENGFTVE